MNFWLLLIVLVAAAIVGVLVETAGLSLFEKLIRLEKFSRHRWIIRMSALILIAVILVTLVVSLLIDWSPFS